MIVFARLAVPLLTAVVAGGTQSRLQITEPDPLEELCRLIEVGRKSEEREKGLDSLLVESVRKLSVHLLRLPSPETSQPRPRGVAPVARRCPSSGYRGDEITGACPIRIGVDESVGHGRVTRERKRRVLQVISLANPRQHIRNRYFVGQIAKTE